MRVAQYSRAIESLTDGGACWFPAFAGMTIECAASGVPSLLRRKDPVPPRVQADQVAAAEFAVARAIDLDQCGPVAGRQRHLGALGWPQRAHAFHRALQYAAADRADLHVVAADEQF